MGDGSFTRAARASRGMERVLAAIGGGSQSEPVVAFGPSACIEILVRLTTRAEERRK